MRAVPPTAASAGGASTRQDKEERNCFLSYHIVYVLSFFCYILAFNKYVAHIHTQRQEDVDV